MSDLKVGDKVGQWHEHDCEGCATAHFVSRCDDKIITESDLFCEDCLVDMKIAAKDARIAELEEKIERLTNFCTSAIYKDESDAPEVWELNLIELLAKGDE